jgi:hypothetical protein
MFLRGQLDVREISKQRLKHDNDGRLGGSGSNMSSRMGSGCDNVRRRTNRNDSKDNNGQLSSNCANEASNKL